MLSEGGRGKMKIALVLIAFAAAICAFFIGWPTLKIILYVICLVALMIFAYLQLKPERNNGRRKTRA